MSCEYNVEGSTSSGESVRLRVGEAMKKEECENEIENRRYDFTEPSRLTMILTISISLVIASSVVFTVVWMTLSPPVGTKYDLSFSLSEATLKPKPMNPTYTSPRSFQEVVRDQKICERTSSDGRLFISSVNRNDLSCSFSFNGDSKRDAKMFFSEKHSRKCTEVEFYYPTFTKFCIYANTTLLIKRETAFTIVLPQDVLETGAVFLNFANLQETIPAPCETSPDWEPSRGWSKCTKFSRKRSQKKCAFKEKIMASDFHLRQESTTKKGWLFGRSVVVPEFQYLQEEIWRNGVISLRRLTHEDGLGIYRPIQRHEDAFYVAIDDITRYGDQFKLCEMNNHFFSIQNIFY